MLQSIQFLLGFSAYAATVCTQTIRVPKTRMVSNASSNTSTVDSNKCEPKTKTLQRKTRPPNAGPRQPKCKPNQLTAKSVVGGVSNPFETVNIV